MSAPPGRGSSLRSRSVPPAAFFSRRTPCGISHLDRLDPVGEGRARESSAKQYARLDGSFDPDGPVANNRLTDRETAFIAERDNFYIASVSETGWPHIQFRGGPPGFLRVLDERTLGYADFRGNRQYI